MDMRITAKNKFRTLVILLLILAVTVSAALWSVLRTRDGAQEAYADTQAADIAATINGAKPWGDVSSVTVGNGAGDNGVVVTIGESDAVDENGIVLKEIVLKTGAQAVVGETLPSAQHELEGKEVYSLVVFDVPVTVQSEAKLTLNADVVFRAGVTVYGTLEINGMAFNQKRDGDYENNGVMTVSNTLNNYSEIKSEGVIVNGSLNNDGERNGTITVSDGSALTVNAGGALFLKADNSNALGVEGTINNGGSVIYQRAATVNFLLGENSKTAIPATFISSLSLSGDDDGRYVFYPEKPDTGEGTALPAGDGTALTLSNGSARSWSGVTLLSFGRTTLKNSENNVSYTFTNVNLGGITNVNSDGSVSEKFTQGANELIFDGGAAWKQGDSSDGYDLYFLVGTDSATRTEYYNDYKGGRYSASALVTVNAGATLNMYGGVKITRHETRAGNGVGGGVSVKSSVDTHDSWGSTYIDSITRANLNMYGGEISYNAVTQCKNNGAGAGVYGYFAEINIAGGKITRNANATYSDGSADGAGLALDASSLTMSGGEISWNCGAVGGTDAGADGGGIIARSEDHNTAVTDETLSTLTASTVTLSGGSISNNWTGGSGGGILLWQSHLTMTGGEIAENGASFGGGIGMTSGKQHTGDDSTSKAGYARINGGTISGNYAFYNEWNTKKPQGGYGGGICVGSNIDAGDNYKLHSFVEFSGEALVTDNRAVYGGGLAVYTKDNSNYNKIIMKGGTVTGNSVDNGISENGNGVYVYCVSNTFTQSEGMLRLSGNASIDTSNNVSFNFNFGTIPIYIYSSGTTLYYCEHNGIWGEHTKQENFFYNNALYIKEGSAGPDNEYYDDIINGTLTATGYDELRRSAREAEPVASSDRHLWYTGSHTVFNVNDAIETYSISGIYEAVRSNSLNISAPITVDTSLKGTQLASLVYFGNDGVTSLWQGKNIISYSNSATVNRNKFLLDSATYTFTETSNALQIAAAEGEDNGVARVLHTDGTKPTYSSLAEAVANANENDTIQILRSATLDKTIVIDKNITIVPNGDFTLYIKSGFDTSGAINPALFRVENGATLTLGGQNTLTVSGNTSEENIPLVTVINGSYVQKSGVTLTGASVNDDAEIHNVQTDASAVYLASSNASATIEGGVIRSNKGGLGAIYVGDGASLTLSGGAIGGALDTDHNVDKNGLEYGVYVTGRGKVSLNGSVALYDAINLSAKGASVTVGAGYANALTDNGTIRLTYADTLDADDVVVNILNTYAGDADTVFSDFALYEMDESLYALRLRGSSDGDSKNALVVQKAVRYIFDFRYSNGYGDGTSNDMLENGMKYSDGTTELSETVINELVKVTGERGFGAERYAVRDGALVVSVFSGSSEAFQLSWLNGVAQKTGWTLSTWHQTSKNNVLSAIGDSASLAYTNSSAPITLRSVWTPNQFNITFDSNYTGLGSGAQPSLIEGTMESQIVDYSDLETSNQEARLTVNNYTAVGFLFTGWSLTGGIDASVKFGDGRTLEATDWDTMIGGVIGVEHEATETKAGYVEYSITLYAVWENLFSGGVGTSANPFKIGKIEDLYILEATTMGTRGSSDSGVSVSEEYYNTHSEDGAAVAYAAENYEGYFFLLTAENLSGFKGVIGRTSSKNAQAKDQDEEITASLPNDVQNSENKNGITDNGTPFAGTFNGDGKLIGLAINKQQLTEKQYADALAAADNKLPWKNGDETLLGAGLFGYTVGATISNLTLTGSVHGYSHVGGLVGYAVNTAISSIYNEAAVSSGGHDVGGIVGTYFVTDESETQYVITNVVNTGAISYAPRLDDKTTALSTQPYWSETKKLSDVQGIRFGGIVGYGITMRLTGGYNTGDVTGRYAVGGVVGILHSLNNNTTSDTTLTNSFNTGAVTATAGLYATVHSADGGVNAEAVNAYVGGLVGRAVGASAIDTAFNSGRVTASWTGVKNTSGEYAGKYVYADLSSTALSADSEYIGARGAGGIVGFTSYDKSANEGDLKSIANVYNTGAISAWASVGGIAGYFAYSTVSRVYNGGSVLANGFHFEGSEKVGGGMQTSDGSYHAFLGSLVGMSIGSSLSDVYYNTDKRYEHFTDETLRQIGDYEYTAETLGFAESTFSSDRGRTASQMSVIAANNRPSGFGTDFSGTYWSFLYYADQTTGEAGQAEEGQPVEGQTYHYPQLNAFAGDGNTVRIGGKSFELGTYSKDSTLVTVPANAGENDKPITDTDSVQISYSLGGGAFTFAGGSDDDGYYFAEGGYRYNLVDGLWQTEVEYKIGGGEAHEELAQLEQPGDPARVGYRFTGWYSDAACREPFSFDSIPASDKTVYAGWEAVTYTFVYEEFSSRGASFVGEHDATFSILDEGSRVDLPTAENVTRRGYTLSGWLYNNKAVDSYRVIAPSSGTPYIEFYSGGSDVETVPFNTIVNQQLYLTAVWEAEPYTITYNGLTADKFVDRENATLNGAKENYTITDSFTFAKPQKKGYTFDGWKLVSLDGKTATGDLDSINKEHYAINGILTGIVSGTVGDIVLEAQWTRNNVTLYLDARGGEIEDFKTHGLERDLSGRYYISVPYYSNGSNALAFLFGAGGTFHVTATLPEGSGRTFNGWYTVVNPSEGDAAITKYFTVKGDALGMGSQTIYAGYQTSTYTITISLGDHADSVNPDMAEELKAAGFDWGKGNNLATAKEFTLINVLHGSDVSAQLTLLASAINVTEGYNFLGWFTEDDKSAPIYNVTSALSITAQYAQNQVTVNFVGLNGALLGSVTIGQGSVIGENNEAYTDIAAKADSYFGYDFKGWYYTDASGRKDFIIADDNNEGDTVSASMVVYADLQAKKITPQFILAIGDARESISLDDYTYYFGAAFGQFPTLDELSNDAKYLGYQISGWSVDGSAVNVNTVITQKMVEDGDTLTIELHAELTKATYTISFIANGGSFQGVTPVGEYQFGDVDSVRYHAGNSDWDPGLPIPKRAGHTYAWTVYDANGTRLSDTPIKDVAGLIKLLGEVGYAGNILLRAEWTAEKYTVWFSANGGTFTVPEKAIDGIKFYDKNKLPVDTAGNPAVYFTMEVQYGTVPYPPVALDAPQQNGFIFLSWRTSDNMILTEVTSEGQYSQGSPIQAYWTEGKYSITFVTNGGTAISDITEISYGADLSAQLEGKTTERDGYTFAGWYYDSDFNDENKVQVGDTMPSKDLVLYAKWEVNSYKLTLNITIDGGTVEKSVVEGAFKELGFTASVAPATNGYTVTITVPYETNLSALNTIKFGENGEYSLSGTWTHGADDNVLLTFMPASDYTVSGEFTASAGDFTVTFYLTGDTVYYKTTVSSGTVIKEEELPNPIRTGYTFIEWRTAEGEKFEFTTQIDEDTTLYAHWKANEYTVTLRGEGVNLDPNPIKVAYGTTLTWSDGGPLPVPARGGYTFEGWYLDADFSTTAEGTAMPAYDITLYAKWKATEYSIVFEWGLESEKTTVTIDGAYNSALDFSSVGGAVPHYTFIWQVTADGKDPIPVTLDDFRTMPNLSEKFAGYTSVVEGRVSITVQAAYTPIGYTITLDGADPVPVTVKDASSEKTEFAKLGDKTGYEFAGWKLSADDTAAYNYYMVGENGGEWGVYLYSDEVSADGNFVPFTEGFSLYLTAAYTANTYTVKFDANGGEVGKSEQEVIYDSVYGDLPVPTRVGYTFDGWFTEQEDGTQITANSTVEITGNQTLFAHWTAIEYKIIYNPGTGTNNLENPSVYTYESAFEFKDPTAPTGYGFLYWMNAATGDPVYEITARSMGDITLIAQYKPNTYTVTFDKNVGDGETTTQGFTYGTAQNLSANAFTRTGYTFAGWATEEDATKVKYENGESVSNLTTENGGTVTLYAVWTANTYTVTFDANGGEGTMDDMPFTYDEEKNLNPINPDTFKRAGYTFKGWARNPNVSNIEFADGASVSNLTSRNGVTVTLYAVWEANTYTVTFDKNVGDGETTTQDFTYDTAQNLNPNAFTRTGYTFAGWATDPKRTEVEFSDGASVINLTATDKDNVTLYAVWRADSYTIVFVGGEFAMGAMNNQTVLYNTPTDLTANGFVRLGYDFLGWAYTDNADSPEIKNGTIWINADWLAEHAGDIKDKTITLHAVWEERTYTLELKANGGDFVDEISSSVSGEYSKYFVLPDAKAFKAREGYTFLGWSKSEIGEDILYNGGVNVPVKLFTDGVAAEENVGMLYAVWTENVYEVTFDGEHVRSNGAASAVYGNTYSAKLTVDTGYTLTQGEISVEMDGTESVQFTYADGVLTISSLVTGDIVITAKAAANTYTIAYEGNGVNIASESGTFGSAVTLDDPTRPGFIFLGWYIDGDEETLYRGIVSVGMLASAAGVKNGETITLNAKWQAAAGALTVTIVHADKSQQTIGVTSGDKLSIEEDIRVPKGYDYTYATYRIGSAQGAVFDFGQKITADMTLHVVGGKLITYTITLDYGYDRKPDTDTVELTVEHGEPLDSAEGWEETPARVGYTFGGWYNGNVRMTGGSIVTSKFALTARWKAIDYTVTFNPNGGSGEQTTQTYHYGDAVALISAPVRDGYTFEGWYYNGALWVSGTAMPAENITLVAMWALNSYTVSFSVGDGATGVADQTIYFGFKATKPTDPVRSGYSFGGWMLDGSEYDFGTSVRDNITLTAKWLPRTYSIDYVLGGGVNASGNPDSYNIESGTIVLANPTREGFIFLGWYDAEQNGNRVTEIKAGSTGRITLYARWQANTYTVDFVLNGGTMKSTEQIVVAGGTVAFEEPTRENYLFMGWFTDAACTQRYDFSTPVTGDLTLYAKWRLSVISGTASDGTIVTITSDEGFDDGTTIRFAEVTDEVTLSEAAGSLAENMTLARLFDIELIAADGTPVSIDKPLSVGISVQGLADAVGRYAVVYVPDGGGTIEEIATHIGEDGRMYFFVEHFSFYAVVDVLDIAPTGGFAWWWILVAVAGCAVLAGIIVLLARSMRRYELNYVNGGVPAQKLKESALVDLPLPEREEEVFDGWYYDEMFRDRATLTSMPKQNLILFAKWRKMTEEERAARDRARAEAAAAAAEGFHEAKPKKEKKHKENPLNEIKEDE